LDPDQEWCWIVFDRFSGCEALEIKKENRMKYWVFLPVMACADKIVDSQTGGTSQIAVGETVSGDLSNGEVLSSLDWAQNSSVACWPGTEHLNFMGSHVFFTASQDPHTLLTATVTPATDDLDVNVYILQQAVGSSQIPPDVTSVVSCEVGFPQSTDSNPGESDSASVTAINNGYDVVIGVAGPEGVTSGEFSLEITSEPY